MADRPLHAQDSRLDVARPKSLAEIFDSIDWVCTAEDDRGNGIPVNVMRCSMGNAIHPQCVVSALKAAPPELILEALGWEWVDD